jgi:hypothetical protein
MIDGEILNYEFLKDYRVPGDEDGRSRLRSENAAENVGEKRRKGVKSAEKRICYPVNWLI